MATRLLTRSKTLTLNRSFLDQSSQSLRPLHSLTSPLDLGAYRPSDSISPSTRFVPRTDLAAAYSSPAIASILGSKKFFYRLFKQPSLPWKTRNNKIVGYDKTRPRWFSMSAQDRSISQLSPAELKAMREIGKVVIERERVVQPTSHVDGKEVSCFSPLETISIRPRSSGLGNESLKIKRTELSQKITFFLIPALVLISKSYLTTSLLVLSVYWQIYGFFKEIFLDYVHQEVTRKWVLIYFKVLLLILLKDTFLDFGLV